MKRYILNFNLLLIVVLFISGLSMSFSWSDVLGKKVKAAVASTYDISEFEIEKAITSNPGSEMSDHLFAVRSESVLIGYIYVGEAPSMKNVFDFILLFSPSFEIVNSKVLIYREKHGRQIGAKRWLKQFTGLKAGDQPVLGENIDGITGATISVTNMTRKVHEVLTKLPSQIELIK